MADDAACAERCTTYSGVEFSGGCKGYMQGPWYGLTLCRCYGGYAFSECITWANCCVNETMLSEPPTPPPTAPPTSPPTLPPTDAMQFTSRCDNGTNGYLSLAAAAAQPHPFPIVLSTPSTLIPTALPSSFAGQRLTLQRISPHCGTVVAVARSYNGHPWEGVPPAPLHPDCTLWAVAPTPAPTLVCVSFCVSLARIRPASLEEPTGDLPSSLALVALAPPHRPTKTRQSGAQPYAVASPMVKD